MRGWQKAFRMTGINIKEDIPGTGSEMSDSDLNVIKWKFHWGWGSGRGAFAWKEIWQTYIAIYNRRKNKEEREKSELRRKLPFFPGNPQEIILHLRRGEGGWRKRERRENEGGKFFANSERFSPVEFAKEWGKELIRNFRRFDSGQGMISPRNVCVPEWKAVWYSRECARTDRSRSAASRFFWFIDGRPLHFPGGSVSREMCGMAPGLVPPVRGDSPTHIIGIPLMDF